MPGALSGLDGASGDPGTHLCCVPVGPRGNVTCRELGTAAACAELAQFFLDATFPQECSQRGGVTMLATAGALGVPSWADMFSAWVCLPIGVTAAMALLWAALGPIYSHLSQLSGFRRFTLDYVGCLEQPIPRMVRFMAFVNACQLLASMISVVLFVINTYMHHRPAWVTSVEVYLAGLYIGIYSVNAVRSEFKFSQLLTEGRIVDTITVPRMLCPGGAPWLTLDFLRCISAISAYDRLERAGVVTVGKTEVKNEVIKMVLRMTTLVVCFASTVLVLEILGEIPLGPQDAYYTTGMGEISFFTLLYWGVETVTTVGYGDFAPKTFLSRMVTASCMIAGVALFTLELNKIFDIMAQQRRGGGIYEPSSRRSHVVLLGGCVRYNDTTMLEYFFSELYHPSYRNDWPNLVIMTSIAESAESIKRVLSVQLPWHATQHVTLLVGSPFHHADLTRCRCDKAVIVYFMSDTSGNLEPLEEDKENILRALSLKNTFPMTPLRLMLLEAESKETALSLGVRAERCFSQKEVCCGVLYLACRGAGWNTMFTNLVVTHHVVVPEDKLAKQPWLKNYLHGVHHDLYGFLPATRFYGHSILQMTMQIYKTHSILVFAVQIEGVIHLSPLRSQHIVSAETVCFGICRHQEDLLSVSVGQVDWRIAFAKQRWQRYSREDAQAGQAGMRIGRIKDQGFVPISTVLAGESKNRVAFGEEGSNGNGEQAAPENGSKNEAPTGLRQPLLTSGERDACRSLRRRSIATVSDGSPRSPKSPWGTSPKSKLLKRSQSSLRSTMDANLDADELKMLEDRVEEMRARAEEKPFLLLMNFSNDWDEVANFASYNTRRHLPFRIPIVILSSTPPTKIAVAAMDMMDDDELGICLGSPSWAEDLWRAGIAECSIIVCLGRVTTSGKGGTISEMLDADVLMVQRMLHRLGQAHKHMVLDFIAIDNIRLMSTFWSEKYALDSEALNHGMKEKVNSFWCLDPHFASGQVFFPGMLASVMAGAYRKPGIIEIMMLFWGPSDAQDPDGVYMVWQIFPRPQHVNRPYGEVALELLLDSADPALCLGLLRRFDEQPSPGASTAAFASKGYVFMNPRQDTIVDETDLIFVLGDASFGRRAHEENLLQYSQGGNGQRGAERGRSGKRGSV